MSVANNGWVRAQHVTGGTFSSVTTKANTVTATTANSLVIVNVYFTAGTPTSVSVTDNASTPNTYAIAVGPIGTTATGGNAIMYQFYGVQVTSGATTVTVNWTGSSTGQAYIEEYTGSTFTTNATIFDTSQSVIQGTTSTAFSMTSFAPTPYSLVVSAYSATVSETTWTPGGASASGLEMTLTGSYGSTARAVQQHLAAYASETAPMGVSTTSKYTGVAGAYKLGSPAAWSLMRNFTMQRTGQSQGASIPIIGTPKSGAVIFIAFQDTAAATSMTAPTGYTSLTGAAFSGSTKYGLFCYKIAAGTETTATIGTSGGGTWTAAIWVLDGADTTTPTDGTASNITTGTGVTTVTTQNITTTNATDVMVSLVMGSTMTSGSYTTSQGFAQASASLGLNEVTSTQTNFHDTFSGFASQGVIGFSAAFRKRSTNPLFSTISDNFDDNSVNTAIWNAYGTTTTSSETSQQLQVTTSTTNGYGGYETLAVNYDLTGNACYVQLVDAGNQALASLEVYPLNISKDASNALFFLIENGNLHCTTKVASSNTNLVNLTYSSTTHKFFRIREASGTIFWDTSADGTSWTNRASVANPFAITALYLDLQAGTYSNEASATTIKFDNFNLAPPTTTTTAITKSLQYTVKTTASAITKSARYTIKTTTAITKQLKYTVKGAVVITKTLKYTVPTHSAITKSLKYAIPTHTAVTKTLKYTVIKPVSLTKSLKYTVRTAPSALTKTTRYTIAKATSATKSVKYTVKTTPAAITKAARYTVIKASPLTKSIKYTVRTSSSITKQLKYEIVRSAAITKSLQYITTGGHLVQRSLKYTVKTTTAKTKALQYTTKTSHSITKSARYTIAKTTAITKSLRYTVKRTNSQTRALTYSIKRTATATTKSLRYAVVVTRLLTLQARYTVKPSPTVSKALKYSIKTTHTLNKGLQYQAGTFDTRTRNLPLEQSPHYLYLQNGINTVPEQNKSNSIMLQ